MNIPKQIPSFFQGQTVRITVTFRDFADALVNPTSVDFYVQRESDSNWTHTAGVAADSTGIYHLDIATEPKSGVYEWRAYGSGTTASAIQGRFYVIPLSPGETTP